MTTAFNQGVFDGAVTTIAEYARICSGGIYDSERGDTDSYVSYYEEKLERANAELNHFIFLTPEEIEERYLSSLEEAEAAFKQYVANNDAEIERGERMNSLIKEWNNPPVLASLKEFMLSQIDISLSVSKQSQLDQEYYRRFLTPNYKSSKEYENRKKAYLIGNVEYYEKKVRDAKIKDQERAEFFRALKEEFDV